MSIYNRPNSENLVHTPLPPQPTLKTDTQTAQIIHKSIIFNILHQNPTPSYRTSGTFHLSNGHLFSGKKTLYHSPGKIILAHFPKKSTFRASKNRSRESAVRAQMSERCFSLLSYSYFCSRCIFAYFWAFPIFPSLSSSASLSRQMSLSADGKHAFS